MTYIFHGYKSESEALSTQYFSSGQYIQKHLHIQNERT